MSGTKIMPGMLMSYAVAVSLVWAFNGWALLQHASLVPEIEGFIPATLLVNMLTAPAVIWIAYFYGEVAQRMSIMRKRRRSAVLN